jgi:predicted ATPase/DNA-binding CsgD family transcriptional regulator
VAGLALAYFLGVTVQAPFADPLSGIDILNKALPLVGRDTEMQMIRYVLNTVALNLPTGPRAMTISGEIGVGKSRLLAEMYGEARQLGFRVLEGRTYESGSMFPFLPFIEALRPVLRTATPEQLQHYLGLATLATATGNEGNRYRVYESDSDEQSSDESGTEIIALVGMPLVAALARLFPELPKMVGVRILPEVLSPDQEKFRLLDAVATLLERIADDQPILLGIDNLQWADSASLELTMYLTVRLHSSRVALIGATRPPNMPSAQAENSDRVVAVKASMTATKILGDLMRQGLLMLLPLSPLDRGTAVQHIHALLPGTLPASIEHSLLNRAEGNPFFLEELVRMLTLKHQLVLNGNTWQSTKNIGTELPSSIMLAVGQRLEGLSSACRETLRVAAQFGRTFPLEAILRVLAADEEGYDGLAAIEEATQAAVIVLAPADETKRNGLDGEWLDDANNAIASVQLTPALYMFCQGIVQEVLHTEMPTQKTGALHSAIGRALEETYGQGAPAHAAELARHYTLGGNKAASLRWSLLAGEDAVRQQAHREAIGHFRTVVRRLEAGESSETTPKVPSLAQLSITIGELWFKLGELELAATSFQKALDRLQSVEQNGAEATMPLQIAQANRLIADVYRMQAKYDQALAHLQAARAALDIEALEEQVIPGKTGDVPWFAGRSFTSGGNALTLERVSTAERILLLQAMATLNILLYRAQEAETALWQSHQLAVQSGDRGSQAFALHLIGWLRGWGVHIHEAIRLQEQAHALYIAIGDPFRAALGEQGLGIIYQALGEMERAHLYTSRGFERARRYGVRYVYGLLHLNFGILALTQGDWTKSEYHLQEAMQEAEFTNNIRLKPLVMLAQASLLFRRGRWQEAERHFQSGSEAAVNTEWYPGALALYGHFLAVTGRHTAAHTQLDKAADYPESPGYGGDFYIPFIAEGYLHLNADERAASYIERIRDLRGFMYYGLSVDRVLGVVATRAGDWHMAEQAFEDGLALCRRANNQPEEGMILYEQARAELMQSGVQAQTVRRVDELCQQARTLFLQYGMQRSVDLVDTLQEGIRQLGQRDNALDKRQIKPATGTRTHMQEHDAAFSEYQLDLSLTKRELEVLRLVAEGHTDREVAETLIISPRTVNRHLSNIFVKIDVPGRAAAVAYAIRQGLV